jgi:hypothetical protein
MTRNDVLKKAIQKAIKGLGGEICAISDLYGNEPTHDWLNIGRNDD